MNEFDYTIEDYLREVIGEKYRQIAKRMLNDHFKKEIESNNPAAFYNAYSNIINKYENYPCQMAFGNGYGVCWLPGSSIVYVYGGERLRIEIDCLTMQYKSNDKLTVSDLEIIVRKVFGGINNANTRSWQVGRIKAALATLPDGVLCPADIISEPVSPVETKKKPGRPPRENVRSLVKNEKPKRIKKRF